MFFVLGVSRQKGGSGFRHSPEVSGSDPETSGLNPSRKVVVIKQGNLKPL